MFQFLSLAASILFKLEYEFIKHLYSIMRCTLEFDFRNSKPRRIIID